MSIQPYTIYNSTTTDAEFTANANSRTGWQQLLPYTKLHVSIRYNLTGSGASFTLYGCGFNDDTGGLQIGDFAYSPGTNEAGAIEWDVVSTSPFIDLRYTYGSVSNGSIEVIITRN